LGVKPFAPVTSVVCPTAWPPPTIARDNIMARPGQFPLHCFLRFHLCFSANVFIIFKKVKVLTAAVASEIWMANGGLFAHRDRPFQKAFGAKACSTSLIQNTTAFTGFKTRALRSLPRKDSVQRTMFSDAAIRLNQPNQETGRAAGGARLWGRFLSRMTKVDTSARVSIATQ